jgi:hypothetical protein
MLWLNCAITCPSAAQLGSCGVAICPPSPPPSAPAPFIVHLEEALLNPSAVSSGAFFLYWVRRVSQCDCGAHARVYATSTTASSRVDNQADLLRAAQKVLTTKLKEGEGDEASPGRPWQLLASALFSFRGSVTPNPVISDVAAILARPHRCKGAVAHLLSVLNSARFFVVATETVASMLSHTSDVVTAAPVVEPTGHRRSGRQRKAPCRFMAGTA